MMRAFVQAARDMLGITLDAEQVAAFEHYATELTAWNERHNLTTIIDPQGILIKHFLDSLTCLLVVGRPGPEARARNLIDVGSGAGFPGLPLRIANPELRLSLVEATGKKCDFLRHMVRELKLDGVEVIQRRAEDIGRDPAHRGRYDWAVARAVARMPVLLEYLLPLVRSGGCCLAQKGETAHAETHEAAHALAVLGGQVQQVLPVELPSVVETRHLVVIKKTSATPDTYPRRAGIPNKKPLVQ